jgi:hypothetical protein
MNKIHKMTRFKCLICDTDVKSQFEYVFLHKTRRQTHVLCHDCTKGYIVPIIEKNTKLLRQNLKEEISYILCPGSYHGNSRNMCKHKINMKDLLSFNSLEFLGDIILTDIWRILYASMDTLKICCPQENCGNLIQLSEDSWESMVICNDCNTCWCIWCKASPYHDKMNCIEYAHAQGSSDESIRSIMFLKEQGELKFCRVCNAPIVRVKDKKGENDGCNKIICSVCGVKSCWLCGATHIDYDHFNDKTGNCAGKLWEK